MLHQSQLNSLWVGNLAIGVTNSDLISLFGQYGAIDYIKLHSLRSYAFVYFKCREDAKAAKDALQGTNLCGSAIKIDFAKSHSQSFGGKKVNEESSSSRGTEFSDFMKRKNLHDTNPNTLVGVPYFKSSYAALGMPSSPSPRTNNQCQREFKRSRIGDVFPPINASLSFKQRDDRRLAFDQLYGKNYCNLADVSVRAGGPSQGHPQCDNVWHGIFAKGGIPICRTRCVPIGEGIASEIPEVLNFSTRIGLDMLMKHMDDTIKFNIVMFLPDNEEDFAPYTEFLEYLGTQNRAGIAKFDDGSTLFLVPPSDFLTKVLNFAPLVRLYGVVQKFPKHAPTRLESPTQIDTQAAAPISSSNLVHGDESEAHIVNFVAAENSHLELPNQIQQLQSSLYEEGQGSSAIDAEKNKRYQATLQFAANLIFQMQQQLQKANTQAGKGQTGNS